MAPKYDPSAAILAAAAEAARPTLARVAEDLADQVNTKRLRYNDPGQVLRESGNRPKYGRPYERVAYTNVEQEHGTSYKRRLRILGSSVMTIAKGGKS